MLKTALWEETLREVELLAASWEAVALKAARLAAALLGAIEESGLLPAKHRGQQKEFPYSCEAIPRAHSFL